MFKNELDQNVERADKDMKLIMAQMPTFFRQTTSATTDKQPEMLKDNASPKEWRTALLNAQLDIKFLVEGFKDCRQTFLEVTRAFNGLFNELKQGYDIQGRVLLTLARNQGLDFDQLLKMYVNDQEKAAEQLDQELNESFPT